MPRESSARTWLWTSSAALVRNEIAAEKGFERRGKGGVHKEVRAGRKHNPGGILELEPSARGEIPVGVAVRSESDAAAALGGHAVSAGFQGAAGHHRRWDGAV